MSAPYYILKPAVDTQETGSVFPAVETYPDYDFKGVNSMHKLGFNEFPNNEPELRFKLAKGANLTDMLGQAAISAYGFLVSPGLKDLMSQLNLVPHKFFPAFIEDQNGTIHDYYWIQLVWPSSDSVINFSKSKFRIRKFSKIIGEISISSFSDFLTKSQELGHIRTIDFEYLEVNDINYDIFPLATGISIYANEKTKAILSSRFTGIEIKSAVKLVVR